MVALCSDDGNEYKCQYLVEMNDGGGLYMLLYKVKHPVWFSCNTYSMRLAIVSECSSYSRCFVLVETVQDANRVYR